VQGFEAEDTPETRGTLEVSNVTGHTQYGKHSLALKYKGLATGRVARAATYTFMPPLEASNSGHYALFASPTLYPGQIVRAEVETDAANADEVQCGLYIHYYGLNDKYELLSGPTKILSPGTRETYTWTIPNLGGLPVAAIGLELYGKNGVCGTLYLDYLTWSGAPKLVLTRPAGELRSPANAVGGSMWRRAWVDGMDDWGTRWLPSYHLVQNEGTGLIMQGSHEWTDYQVEAKMQLHLITSCGVAVRVQGMRRYYALLICNDGQARLVKVMDGKHELASSPFAFALEQTYALRLQVSGNRLQGWIDGVQLFDCIDGDTPLDGGSVALVVEEGCITCDSVSVS
jgi:hypothetical protein